MRANKKFTLLTVIISLVLVFTLTACAGGNDDHQVTIECENTLNVVVGETGKFFASVDMMTENKTLTYTSGDPSKLTIDNDGKYEAKAVGTTTITVKAYDGTKKVVAVTITTLAESINVEITESDVLKKDPKLINTYCLFVKTTNDEEYFDIKVDSTVLPSDASQKVEITLENNKLGKVEGNKVKIKLPKKGTLNIFDVVANVKADNVTLPITFKVCPIDGSHFEFDYSNGKDDGHTYNAKENRIIAPYSHVNLVFKRAYNFTCANVDFTPDVEFVVSIKGGSQITTTVEMNFNRIVLEYEGVIDENILTPIVIQVKDKLTDQIYEDEINLFYKINTNYMY